MSRVRPEGIDQFHERLEQFKRSSKASLSIKDVVAKSMRKIEEARNYGATWDDVAELLSESFATEDQGGLQVTGKTVQGYYSKILKERLRPKKVLDQSTKEARRGRSTGKTNGIDNEPEHESNQDMNASSNGLDIQPQTDEHPSPASASIQKKSPFNFNTVRP